MKSLDQLALSTSHMRWSSSTLGYHDGVHAFSQFSSMKMVIFKDNQEKILFICNFSPKFVLFPSFHPSCYVHTGVVYCYGAAILLRAESGGEVIAWLAYGKPPSSSHLSLPFIIQLYLFPAAKLFIIKFILCLSGLLPLFLFTGCSNLELEFLYKMSS